MIRAGLCALALLIAGLVPALPAQAAPFVPVVFAVTPTSVRIPAPDATWGIKIVAHPANWETRAGGAAMTVQLSYQAAAPSNLQPIPTVASYANAIAAYAPDFKWRSKLRPTWLRVGSRTGKWTDWIQVDPT